MFGLGDLVKLLEQIPLWKRLAALPPRIEELEKRIATLEAKGTRGGVGECLSCGGKLKVTAERPDRAFGRMGVKEIEAVCEVCGQATTRQWRPDK